MTKKPRNITVSIDDGEDSQSSSLKLENGKALKNCKCCEFKCESFSKIQEEVKLLCHQANLRENKIVALTEEKERCKTSLKEMEKNIQLKEDSILNMKLQKDKLLDMVDKLAYENANIKHCIERGRIETINNDGRPIKERFAETLKDKVTIVTIRRKLRQSRSKHEELSQKAELMSMEAEDQSAFIMNHLFQSDEGYGSTASASCIFLPRSDELSDNYENKSVDMGRPRTSLPFFKRKSVVSDHEDHFYTSGEHRSQTKSGSGGLISFGGFKSFGHGISTHGGFQGLKQKLDLTFFDDAYVEEKVRRSAFGNEIKRMEVELKRLANQTKEQNDNYQSSLYFIFGETLKKGKCLLENPRADFVKQLHESLTGIGMSMREMIKIFRASICAWIDREGPVKDKWLEESRGRKEKPGVDAETQVTPSDLMITSEMQKLSQTVEYLTDRVEIARKEHTSKLTQLEAVKEKSDVMSKFMQQKLFDLHDSLYEALHAVFRHRYQWTNRVPNNFTDLYSTKMSLGNATPAQIYEFNLAVSTAVEKDRKLLREFAYYFVSDEVFGTDLSVGATVSPNLPTPFGTNKNIAVQKKRTSITSMSYETRSGSVEFGQYSRKSKEREASTKRSKEKEKVNLAVKKHIKRGLCHEPTVPQEKKESFNTMPLSEKGTLLSRKNSAVSFTECESFSDECPQNENREETVKHSFPKLQRGSKPTGILTDFNINIQHLPELCESQTSEANNQGKNFMPQASCDFIIQNVSCVVSDNETDDNEPQMSTETVNTTEVSNCINTTQSLGTIDPSQTQKASLCSLLNSTQRRNKEIFFLPTSPCANESVSECRRVLNKVSGASFRTSSIKSEGRPSSLYTRTEDRQRSRSEQWERKYRQRSTEKRKTKQPFTFTIDNTHETDLLNCSTSYKSDASYSSSIPEKNKVQPVRLHHAKSSGNLILQRETGRRSFSSVPIKSISLIEP